MTIGELITVFAHHDPERPVVVVAYGVPWEITGVEDVPDGDLELHVR